MKKATVLIAVVLLLAIAAGGFLYYAMQTPEYALKTIARDVKANGMDGLAPHLTGSAKTTMNAISAVAGNSLVQSIVGFFAPEDYTAVLKEEMNQVEWGLQDLMKGKRSAAAILTFQYKDTLSGTVEISMVLENKEWKISEIQFPKFTQINRKAE